LKQTFAVRFNRRTERTGHVWGDRYWSRVLEREPPEEAGEVDWAAVNMGAETGEISFGAWSPDRDSPLIAENPVETGFSPQASPDPRLRPAKRPNPHGITGTNPLHSVVRHRRRARSVRSPPPPG
jgi:hypothetical protein